MSMSLVKQPYFQVYVFLMNFHSTKYQRNGGIKINEENAYLEIKFLYHVHCMGLTSQNYMSLIGTDLNESFRSREEETKIRRK